MGPRDRNMADEELFIQSPDRGYNEGAPISAGCWPPRIPLRQGTAAAMAAAVTRGVWDASHVRALGIQDKYRVSMSSIKHVYRRNLKGITVRVDDDMLRYYCNEDVFSITVERLDEEYFQITMTPEDDFVDRHPCATRAHQESASGGN
ncbi:unnamed protein product [Notodromas monacha]|uniref:GRHL1/CP2 C-terminal domain-containing protein n=1 Tax=Notodromas monacha TaxID=399045 RepID=A0A7R9BCS0_9CRUS|nr:unnamed protein product [Notodromas monacha]CAG0912896.1 unnamed protein product [Notodromas monacha]